MKTNSFGWLAAAFTALFWLLRQVAVPAAKYALALLACVAFLLVSPLVLLAKCWQVVKPLLHRLAAATLLLFCQPRSKDLDGALYTFCRAAHV